MASTNLPLFSDSGPSQPQPAPSLSSTSILDPVQDVQRLQRFEQISQLFKQAIRGQVMLRGQDGFHSKTQLFNAAAQCHSWIVVSPLDTQEVVSVVNICRENRLSPSIKSGGFATAGWALQGDVMVDLSQMNQIQLRVPSSSDLALYTKSEIDSPLLTNGSTNRRKVSEAFPSELNDGRKKSVPSIKEGCLDESKPSSSIPRPGLGRAVKWNSTQLSNPGQVEAESLEPIEAELTTKPTSAAVGESEPKLPRVTTGESGMEADVESGEESHSEDTPSDSPPRSESNGNSKSRAASLSNRQASTSLSNNSSSEMNGVQTDSSSRMARSVFKKSHNQTSNWVDRLGQGGSWNETDDTSTTSASSGIESAQQEKTRGEASPQDKLESNVDGRSSRKGSGETGSSTSEPATQSPSAIQPLANGVGASRIPSGSAGSSGRVPASPRKPLSEHERWKRHHGGVSPNQASTSKITLPASGGFIWRSGEDGGAASVTSVDGSMAGASSLEAQMANSTTAGWPGSSGSLSDANHPMHPLAGSTGPIPDTLSGLQSAWPDYISSLQNYRHGAGGSSSSSDPVRSISRSRLSPPGSGALYHGSSFASPSPIPPGLYKERFALASFGPGANVRQIDAYTDRAGRDSNFVLPTNRNSERVFAGKGKGRQLESNDEADSMDLDFNAAEEEQKRFGQVVKGAPYHCPMSAYPVGSASLLSGGFGYLTRSYGLSLDNVVEVEVVLADGRVVTLNESSRSRSKEEADLWWAVRGAASCFGIATRITCKAYPVPSVYSGNLIYPFNPSTAGSLICHWRDCLKSGAPRELYSNLILTAGPDSTSHVVVIQVSYLGSKSEGEPFVSALSSWTGERVLLKDVEERSFLSQQDGVASVLKESLGRRWMIRGDLVSTLTDNFIAKSVLRFRALGIRAVWLFELVGGAVEDLDDSDTAIGATQRGAKFTIAALQQWTGSEEDTRCIESVDRWISEDVAPFSTGGPYPCFLERNEPLARVASSFGTESFKKLRNVKKQVDPEGMFRHTFGKGLVFSEEDQASTLMETDVPN